MKKYELGDAGWVGYKPYTSNGKTSHHWWDGPGLGILIFVSLSALGDTTAVYPTRRQLVDAARKVGANVKPQKVADAEAIAMPGWIRWWERVCREADVKLDNRLPDKTLATRWMNRGGSPHTLPAEIALWRARWVYALEHMKETCNG